MAPREQAGAQHTGECSVFLANVLFDGFPVSYAQRGQCPQVRGLGIFHMLLRKELELPSPCLSSASTCLACKEGTIYTPK